MGDDFLPDETVVLPRLLEGLRVKLRHAAPHHVAPQLVGVLAHRMAQRFVPQQFHHGDGDGLGVAERHELAAFRRQQFRRVPVGRGHHGVARAERIGQRARSDLRFGQIRREINVRRADEPHQFLQLDEAIEEHDVLLHAEVFGQPLQAQAVSLALVAQQIRMRLAQHDVNDVGKFPDDVRQRPQRILDALVRRQQSEREQHLLARHAELVLEIIRVGERHVGNAVRDEINLGRRRLINFAQKFPAAFAHHHQPGRKPDQLAHHAPLLRVRLAQHRVQRGDDGHLQFAQQRQHMAARRPAENAELMLHANHVHVRDVQKIRRAQIRRQVLLRNLEAHLRRIIVTAREVIDRHDQALHRRKFRRHGAAQVGRERGNAAFPRQIIAEKRDLADGRGGLHESLVGGTGKLAYADNFYDVLRDCTYQEPIPGFTADSPLIPTASFWTLRLERLDGYAPFCLVLHCQ